MSRLSNRVAVVTGASKGIGAGIAKGLAAEGASVVVNYSSSKDGADRVVADIKAKGGKAIAVQGDVAKAKDVQRIFAETRKAFGRLDVLVNNAGVYEFAPIEQVTEEQFHRQFNTNVLGLILATQEAVKHFGTEGGNVINISSAVTSITPPTGSVYTATKGAVDMVTQDACEGTSARARFASTRLTRESSKPKARTVRESSATSRRALWRKRHYASVSRTTSRPSRCFSRRLIPDG